MAGPTQAVSGTISTAGAANGVIQQLTNPDVEGLCIISGTFASAVLFFDASVDGITYCPVLAVRLSDLATMTSDPTGFATTDSTNRMFRVLTLEGLKWWRVWAYSLGSGSINVQLSAGSFFGSAPVAAAIGAALTTTQVLFQLEQIRLALYWLKEPGNGTPPTLAGGGLWSFLGSPVQG